ncbi:MAG: acetyl-CoA carboxylase biotin carboxylase subunit [Deltaproteobacteria bacterium]|nr:acetyl-CoA carboxylase biotin carboxylase subunit [Deltaproteobacteria bacterium]
MINKVLIANRGEIALRIIRACRENGIQSVLVYSTADRDSLPVKLADQAICIGPPESKDSYLNVPSLLSAVEVTDADAVHPGYGFLAENAAFAEICENYGVNFIGPPSSVIRLMGNKIEARKLVSSVKVPILPGSDGPVVEEEEGMAIAKKIGFPVIIKAAAGGGGRGMKIVHSTASFINAFLTAQSEALAGFGLPDVYIEKYFEDARHVEVQVLGDTSGSIIHLGDRDCSVQRRHQKLLEEALAPGIPARMRKKIHAAAVEVAKAVGYVSAGTVEFLYIPDKEYFFLEMNTRIQVEHPVTEMITGIDLVKEQLKIADGKKLKIEQANVRFKGHAIECRINAEDPEKFIPSPGLVKTCYLPGGYGVRVDTAMINGYIIPAVYDSLIAKVICWGEDRKEAIARMKRALDEIVFEGIQTTVGFQKKIMNDPDFVEGKLSTRFIEKYGGS